MTSIIPRSMLRALRGAPANCLLMLRMLRVPVSAATLCLECGFSENTVAKALRILKAYGLVEWASHEGWRTTAYADEVIFHPLAQSSGAAPEAAQASACLPATPEACEPAPPPEGIAQDAPLDGESRKICDPVESEEEVNPKKLRVNTSSDSTGRSRSAENARDTGPPAGLPAVEQILEAAEELFGEPVLGSPARYPDARLLLGWIAEAYQKRRLLRNPSRVVYSNLKRGEPPQRRYLRDPCAYLPESFLQQVGLAPPEQDEEAEEAWDEAGQEDEPPESGDLPPAVDASLSLPAGRSEKTAAQAWEAGLLVLKEQMREWTFREWFEGVRLAFYRPESCAFIAAAPDDQRRALLQDRLTSALQRILTGICNHPALVEFITE